MEEAIGGECKDIVPVEDAELAIKHLDFSSENLVRYLVADKGFVNLELGSVPLVLLSCRNVCNQDTLAPVDEDSLALSANVSRFKEEISFEPYFLAIYHYRVHSHVVQGIFALGHALGAKDSNEAVVHSPSSHWHKHYEVVRFHDGSNVPTILSVPHAMSLHVCLDSLVEISSGLCRYVLQLLAGLSDNSLHY